jgi:hypothetical protein
MLGKLYEAARECSNVDYRALLKSAADVLDTTITHFNDDPTENNLIALNCAWAYGHRLLINLPPEGTPAPLGGDTEPARLAA